MVSASKTGLYSPSGEPWHKSPAKKSLHEKIRTMFTQLKFRKYCME